MPQRLTRACLSEHDRQVLDSIFDPLELTLNVNRSTIKLDDDDVGVELIDIENSESDKKELFEESKTLEINAVKLAESEGKLDEALRLFEQAIEKAPTRASIYNNRAQALRLAERDDEALQDLNKAIEIADRQLRTKCHAYCQRAVLFRKRENLDAARKDFEEAAKMGSNFAKAQLVEINPFAALCNQMLRQAFEQLK